MFHNYVGAERTGISILFGSKNAVTCDILTGGQVQSIFCYVCGYIYITGYDGNSININPSSALQVLRCYSPPSYLESGVGRVPLKVMIALTFVVLYILTKCNQSLFKRRMVKRNRTNNNVIAYSHPPSNCFWHKCRRTTI